MFEQATLRQKGVLSAELGITKQELLRKALNDTFKKLANRNNKKMVVKLRNSSAIIGER